MLERGNGDVRYCDSQIKGPGGVLLTLQIPRVEHFPGRHRAIKPQ